MNFGIDIDDTISNTFDTFLPFMKKFVENDLNKKLDLNLTQNSVGKKDCMINYLH